jgi:hypothetical protein
MTNNMKNYFLNEKNLRRLYYKLFIFFDQINKKEHQTSWDYSFKIVSKILVYTEVLLCLHIDSTTIIMFTYLGMVVPSSA